MTTFQAVIYAIIHGISNFVPISPKAQLILISYTVGWPEPSGALITAFTFGSLMALLVYFRHDLASMVSSVLQLIIFRKRPMTLDERIPLFIGVTTLPMIVVSFYFHHQIHEVEWSPIGVAAIMAISGIPLLLFDQWNRKNKGMCDWKWLDAFIIGIAHATTIFPGWDPLSGLLLGAFFLNYKREAALKYAYYAVIPVLLARTFFGLREIDFHAPTPMADLSWLSFGVGFIVSWFFGVLAIGGLFKHFQQKGVGQYVAYRLILALIVCGVYWFRNH